MPDLKPFTLDVDLLPKTWGGSRLGALYDDATPQLGEAWLCADLASTSASGAGGQPMVSSIRTPRAGGPRTLHDALTEDARGYLGFHASRFPLLVKLLDAAEHLSVQVHPSPAYAAAHPGAHRKSEAWYVLNSAPGAVLMLGLRDISSASELRAVVNEGSLPTRLASVPAEPGRCCWLPSGLVHALGAGSLVFEVQTASDTTYRLYDWTQEYGRAPRAMHIDEAAEATDFSARAVWGADGLDAGEGIVISTPDFVIGRVAGGTAGAVDRVLPMAPKPRAHLVVPIGAAASLSGADGQMVLPSERVTMVPATGGDQWTLQTAPDGMALVIRVCAPSDPVLSRHTQGGGR